MGTEFKKYFEMLFQKKRINEGRAKLLLKALGRKKILQPSGEMLDSDISEEEVLKTMESLPTGKQAGPNRIPNAVRTDATK